MPKECPWVGSGQNCKKPGPSEPPQPRNTGLPPPAAARHRTQHQPPQRRLHENRLQLTLERNNQVSEFNYYRNTKIIRAEHPLLPSPGKQACRNKRPRAQAVQGGWEKHRTTTEHSSGASSALPQAEMSPGSEKPPETHQAFRFGVPLPRVQKSHSLAPLNKMTDIPHTFSVFTTSCGPV